MEGKSRFVATVFVIGSCLVTLACSTAPPKVSAVTSSASPAHQAAVISPPPPGGEIPAELRGLWQRANSDTPPQYSRLRLTSTGWSYLQAGGSAVVSGHEIDLYASWACEFTDAVGRYSWTLTGDTLHFGALNTDPCDRHLLFDNVSYVLIRHMDQ